MGAIKKSIFFFAVVAALIAIGLTWVILAGGADQFMSTKDARTNMFLFMRIGIYAAVILLWPLCVKYTKRLKRRPMTDEAERVFLRLRFKMVLWFAVYEIILVQRLWVF